MDDGTWIYTEERCVGCGTPLPDELAEASEFCSEECMHNTYERTTGWWWTQPDDDPNGRY